MDEIDKILTDVAMEEEKLEIEQEQEDWYCTDCEHGPMMPNEVRCSRCGTRVGKTYHEEELTGWEDEDIDAEVEEIW